eukprot:CAMPEP_0114337336 /NCGR_PEP_ID=MMETSP0101-20121206/6299_1 /TAXON_ID=38822 ORGANISM="Pteridomonas danica, Strain PT" /NCGR_SAMPLE_ID=MMETSP0101 /ASSEMBLY_ACC=CAM_ASM_000211 /LENGTH=222 /DNA_ID=CAMNT_0001469545 /DNA_START=91 /DNA_END=759 /DNA_ORIENTATION=+
MAANQIKLEYFPIEGAAEKIRLALVMTGTEFDDVRVPFDQWPARKATSKTGQMPIMTINGEEYYQSDALLRYVARTGDGSLYPCSDPLQALKIDSMLELANDFARALTPSMYVGRNPQMFGHGELDAETKDAMVKGLREKFAAEEIPKFAKMLTEALENSPFLCGDSVTIADLKFLPTMNHLTKGVLDYIPKDCLEAYPAITAWMTRVREIPQIAAWYAAKA